MDVSMSVREKGGNYIHLPIQLKTTSVSFPAFKNKLEVALMADQKMDGKFLQ